MPGALLQAPTAEQHIAAHIVQECAHHPVQPLSGDRMVGWRFEAQLTPPQLTGMDIRPVPLQQALPQERLPEPPWPPRVLPTTRRPITRLTIPDGGALTVGEAP